MLNGTPSLNGCPSLWTMPPALNSSPSNNTFHCKQHFARAQMPTRKVKLYVTCCLNFQFTHYCFSLAFMTNMNKRHSYVQSLSHICSLAQGCCQQQLVKCHLYHPWPYLLHTHFVVQSWMSWYPLQLFFSYNNWRCNSQQLVAHWAVVSSLCSHACLESHLWWHLLKLVLVRCREGPIHIGRD